MPILFGRMTLKQHGNLVSERMDILCDFRSAVPVGCAGPHISPTFYRGGGSGQVCRVALGRAPRHAPKHWPPTVDLRPKSNARMFADRVDLYTLSGAPRRMRDCSSVSLRRPLVARHVSTPVCAASQWYLVRKAGLAPLN